MFKYFMKTIDLYGIIPYVCGNKKIFGMEKALKVKEMARFDTKISKELKQFFERAASIGGYRTLTEFVISSAQEKAKAIVEQQSNFLASERDRKIFFDAILKAEEPNRRLIEAGKRYKEALAA